ncbi:SPOR domain-containing protein [Marinobacter salinisoli]|uniref:SPOR domain-containing protein n=1 Tax=Marinobacter salinisoli TaxID=2769486 RepID=A0ABX7MNC2_9GAMM|nr:SPOR domain-containing protein [Marinobacter salinisoli]QSP93756.1 SPOR domain-containing protein [Marinobacter salinisoli]
MDGLKQRIVGALVLVSLAVIFVPMIFDEPHSERTSNSIQIPEEPPFPEVVIPEDQAAGAPIDNAPQATGDVSESPAEPGQSAPDYRIVEDEPAPFEGVPQVDETPAANSEPAPDPAPATPGPKPEVAANQPSAGESSNTVPNPVAEGDWVVQLGSFGNADNARRLRDQVREKGYGSHLEAIKRGDATLTRVFSGPFPDRPSAEAAKRVLDEAFSLNSLVTTGDK